MTDSPRGLIIRSAHSNEAPAIKALESECGLSAWAIDDYVKAASDPDWILLVAELDRYLVGFCLTRLITRQNNQSIPTQEPGGPKLGCNSEKEAEICNMAVAKRYRRRGIGRSILLECLRILGESSTVSVFLEVRKSNIAATEFYKSRGFEIHGIRGNYYSDPVEDAFVMMYFARNGIKVAE